MLRSVAGHSEMTRHRLVTVRPVSESSRVGSETLSDRAAEDLSGH
jgi:hypothetical protein